MGLDVNGVVALSAAQGTGKTELATVLATRLHGPHASVSAYISFVLSLEGLNPSPQLLRERGAQLVQDPSALVRRVLDHYKWERGTGLVFDSIRHDEVLTVLRAWVRPQPLLHVALAVSEEEREARLRARSREPYDPSLASHSTEVQVPDLVSAADLVLDGTSPVDQLASEVLDSLAEVRR
jgi:hypothetical protein